MSAMMAFFSGVMLSVMLQMNQGLSAQYGAYHAALYIHLIGAVFAGGMLCWKKKLPSAFQPVPLWMYLGGVSGVVTMLCNNLSYGHISLTSIMALGIFAQIVLSVLMDSFGWLGAAKKVGGGAAGIVIATIGAIWLLDASLREGGVYILLSIAAGAAVIVTRAINARLAAKIGEGQSALINCLSGLPLCLFFALCTNESPSISSVQPWMWFGGVLSVGNVMLCNVLVPKLSASGLTMLALCGQLLCGVLLDLLCNNMLASRELMASAMICVGILVNSFARYVKAKRKLRRRTH